MAKIVLIGNYKGGVGKTTNTFCLAAMLAKMEKKVLVLDLDPQASLSEIMVKRSDGVKNLHKLPDEETLNYILNIALLKLEKRSAGLESLSNDKLIKQCRVFELRPFDYIPSSPFYSNGYMGLDAMIQRMEDKVEHLSILNDCVNSIKEGYDYILIDTPPSNNLLTKSAILMSDYYVVPTILDDLSTNGIVHYIETVGRIYRKYCIENDDATIAKRIFGNETKLIGVFTNLVRDGVTYDGDRERLEKALAEKGMDKKIIMHTKLKLHVDTARVVGNGYIDDKLMKKYKPIAEEFCKRLDSAG